MRWLLVMALLGCQASSPAPPIPPPPMVNETPAVRQVPECDEAGIEGVRIGRAAPKVPGVARASVTNPCARSRP